MDASLINNELKTLYEKYWKKYAGIPYTDRKTISLPSFIECSEEYVSDGNNRIVFIHNYDSFFDCDIEKIHTFGHPFIDECIRLYSDKIKDFYLFGRRPYDPYADVLDISKFQYYTFNINSYLNGKLNYNYVFLSDKPLGTKPLGVDDEEFAKDEVDFLKNQLIILNPSVVLVFDSNSIAQKLGSNISYYPLPLSPSFIYKYESHCGRMDFFIIDGIESDALSKTLFYSCECDFYENDDGTFANDHIKMMTDTIIFQLRKNGSIKSYPY